MSSETRKSGYVTIRNRRIDFDTQMKRIQKDFKELMKAEKKSQEDLMGAFKTLEYEL